MILKRLNIKSTHYWFNIHRTFSCGIAHVNNRLLSYLSGFSMWSDLIKSNHIPSISFWNLCTKVRKKVGQKKQFYNFLRFFHNYCRFCTKKQRKFTTKCYFEQPESHDKEFSEQGFFSSEHEKSTEWTEKCWAKVIIFFIALNNLNGLIINDIWFIFCYNVSSTSCF